MAQEKKTVKKVAAKAASKAAPVKAAKPKAVAAVKAGAAKSGEDLVVENFSALSQVVESLAETLEMLVQKTESMAYHIIATEEVLAEVVASNGLNLARVNARIRNKVATGGEIPGDPSRAIDIAAAIASPLPKR